MLALFLAWNLILCCHGSQQGKYGFDKKGLPGECLKDFQCLNFLFVNMSSRSSVQLHALHKFLSNIELVVLTTWLNLLFLSLRSYRVCFLSS